MRFVLFAGGMLLAILLGPKLQGLDRATSGLTVEPLKAARVGAFEVANDVAGGSLGLRTSDAGDASLIFIATPSALTMPILPDVPERIPRFASADRLPSAAVAPPRGGEPSGATGAVPLGANDTPRLSATDVVPLGATNIAPLGVTEIVPLVQSGGQSGGQSGRQPGQQSAATQPGSGPRHAVITATSLNMRSGPAKRYDAVTALYAGDAVEITGARDGGWLPIKVAQTGQEGWVFHRYVAEGAGR